MSRPAVLVLGAGSAGQRHARLLAAAGAAVSVTDPDMDRARSVGEATVVPFDLDDLGHWDGVIVASPTAYHGEQVPLALDAAAKVLVEKPLAMSGEAARRLASHAGHRLMVGYNLRLHEPNERLVEAVHSGWIGRPVAVRLWFGSYLPDWRPKVDYRTTYSARRALGGGVLLDAIHELDLLLWLLPGEFEVLGASVDSVGDLEIDVEDRVHAVLRHCDTETAAVVELDYLSRVYRRGVEVVGTEGTIRLDWARKVIETERSDRLQAAPAASDVLDSYRRQAERFLQWVLHDRPPPVDGHAGATSVELADHIRRAAER